MTASGELAEAMKQIAKVARSTASMHPFTGVPAYASTFNSNNTAAIIATDTPLRPVQHGCVVVPA